MSDPITRLTKATMDLKKFTSIFNYWSFIEIIIYLSILSANIVFFSVFQEAFLTIIAALTLFFIVLAFLAVFFVKDTQKQIMLTIIRAFIGGILPLAVIFGTFGPLALWLKILGGVLTILGLLILYLLLRPVLKMNAITKELIKAQKSK